MHNKKLHIFKNKTTYNLEQRTYFIIHIHNNQHVGFDYRNQTINYKTQMNRLLLLFFFTIQIAAKPKYQGLV